MKICLYCNMEIVKNSTDSMNYFLNKRKYCNTECMRQAFKGKNVSPATQFKKGDGIGESNSAWKGGHYHSKEGYIYTRVGIKKYVLAHRIVMEKHLGRELARNEHVHHINGIKTDNRIENLVVLDPVEHGRIHALQRWHNHPIEVT